MKAVTIDRLDIKDHVRWANDQQEYDVSFVNESHLVAPHPEILGTSAIYSSKFEELFELQKKNISWAFFSQPKNFHMFSKRFFSYRLFPSIYLDDRDQDDGDQEKEDQDDKPCDLIKEILKLDAPHLKQSLLEKDKTVVLNLLNSIKEIDRMIRQVNGRKLQYQKG
jgi:hypothetical protein